MTHKSLLTWLLALLVAGCRGSAESDDRPTGRTDAPEPEHATLNRAQLEQALEMRSRSLPDDHPDLQRARSQLASTIAAESARAPGGRGSEAWERGREECLALAASLASAAARNGLVVLFSSSRREAEERCSVLARDLSTVLSFAGGYGVFDPDPGLARDAFVLSETTRAGALASAELAGLAHRDARYGNLREELLTAGEELAQLAQTDAAREAFAAALARRERAQQELVRLASEAEGAAGIVLGCDPAALSERLSESDAIVAYRRFSRREIVPGDTEPRSTESLCAFVLRKGSPPRCVELGAYEPIEKTARDWHARLTATEGAGLRRLVFDPLLPELGGVDRLTVVLDDALHTVPFDALPLEPKETAALLGDRYRVEVRLSLLERAEVSGRATMLVALGGAAYFSEPLPLSAADSAPVHAKDAPSGASPARLRGGSPERGFELLARTGEEAHEIAAIFRSSLGADAVVLENRKASRDSLRELAPKARFLHVATHGWFAPDSVGRTVPARVRGSSPLLLCGLALAGANLPANPAGGRVGLLTGEEISGWDLSSCELAVLSGGNTNVGDRRAGQGVASLQKALHLAGARTVITSLWKVPDEATKELMLDFYRRLWIDGEPKARALWNAKRTLRDAADESGARKYATRDWAAWVLTGDPQ